MPSALQMLIHASPADQPCAPIWIEPDLVIIDDVYGPAALRLMAEHFGAHSRLARPGRIHVVSSIDVDNAPPDRVAAHEALQAFAQQHGLMFTHEIGGCGEGCAPLAPRGTGWVIATARKCDPAAAAAGCISLPMQPLDLAGLMVSGMTWASRPPIQHVHIQGRLAEGITIHDLAIAMRPLMRQDAWARLHWAGAEPAALASLCALLLGDSPALNVFAGAPEDGARDMVLDASTLTPLLGEGFEARPVADEKPTDVDRVYIGSCTTGSVADLRLAAEVLAGQRVHVPTVIAPASMRDVALLRETRLTDGGPSLETIFREAGCDLGLPGCAACVNALGDLHKPNGAPDRLTVVATAVANVSTQQIARVLTAGPVTAAHIALHGRIGGPRVRHASPAAASQL